jgi:hypothetical protein
MALKSKPWCWQNFASSPAMTASARTGEIARNGRQDRDIPSPWKSRSIIRMVMGGGA